MRLAGKLRCGYARYALGRVLGLDGASGGRETEASSVGRVY